MDHSLYSAQLNSLWSKVPQRQVTQLLIIALLIYIALSFAKITWLFFPQAEQSASATLANTQSISSTSSTNVKLDEIQKLHLFGEYNKKQAVAKPVEQIQSAPVTRLKLVLTGLVASNDPKTAAAIIESKGKQETYGIDEKITGTRAILKQVQRDRVIIETSGRMETLMLDGFEYTKTAPQQVTKKATSKSANRRLKINKAAANNSKQSAIKEKVSALRENLLKDPTKLTDIIKISPYRLDGKIKGYRLMPNKDPEFFTDMGLKAGDIAVQINGSDLTDMRQAQQALVELKTAEQVNLLVERNGQLFDVSLGLK